MSSLRKRTRGGAAVAGAGPSARPADTPSASARAVSPPVSALKLFLFLLLPARLVAAFLNPVGDCDETFNYWEPTHFLVHGYGLQTWEYSPEYALRSYSYVGAHAALARAFQLAGLEAALGRPAVFFAVRAALGTACAACEAVFVSAVSARFGGRVGYLTAHMMALSAGMFNAGAAFLPQSFTMCCLLLSFAAWLRSRDFAAVTWMGAAALVGWPFAVLLGALMGVDIARRRGVARTLAWGVAAAAPLVAVPVAVDYWFYRRPVFAALNIAVYNSVTNTHGSNLYGVEPWTYYAKNLALNFNVAAPLSLLLPAAAAGVLALSSDKARRGRAAGALALAFPYLAWLGMMLAMPHKEERFLFVVYPLLCFSAAYALAELSRALRGLRLPLSSLLVPAALLAFDALSASRIAATVRNYSAPFAVYDRLYREEVSAAAGAARKNVCVGKEWYRFPSAFFFPPQGHLRLQFLKSDFGGLLPKAFEEGRDDATSLVPTEQNDMNREEPSRYVAVGECDYMVDLDLADQHEPHYGALPEWEVVVEAPFLVADRSPAWSRALYVPFGVSESRNAYAQYQLLRRVAGE